MRGIWLLPAKLAAIHLFLIIALFVFVAAGHGDESVMAWGVLFTVVDFPISMLMGKIDQLFWMHDMLWYNDNSWIFLFSHRMGWDHLNVGYAILFFIGGTFQWGVVGLIIQACREQE